ncbi:MAG: c-type cytochrome [Gemmatimonadales bacterium]
MASRLLVAAVTLLLSGCNWYYDRLPSPDDLVKMVPWFDHMVTSRAFYPYASGVIPRTAVPGTVPITGSEGNWQAEFASGNAATADRLVNPSDPAATLARGDTLYQHFCGVCHGASGGVTDATVGPRLGAWSLLTERARALSDGYLYSIIRYGRGGMPPYADKLYRPGDRWAVVNYVRKLQRDAGPVPVPAPAPGAPAGPGGAAPP